MEISSLYWASTLQGERLGPRQRVSALRTGFITQWNVFESYKPQGKLLCPSGQVRRTYFPAELKDLWLKFAKVHDQQSLVAFVKQYGLLGCNPGGKSLLLAATKRVDVMAGKVTSYRAPDGDDVEQALRHAVTVRTIYRLIGALNRVRPDNPGFIAAEVADILNQAKDLAYGPTLHGPLDPGPVQWTKATPLSTAYWILRMLINTNLEGIRTVVCASSIGQSRLFQTFERLTDLIYWQLAHELSTDLLRRCARSDCQNVFKTKTRRQVYCSRGCLDLDKMRRYRRKSSRARRTR